INERTGGERSEKIDIARAADAGHICTKCFCDLHRERAHASGSAVNQDLLPRLHISPVANSLQCRYPRYINRSCLLECQVGWFQRQRARRARTYIFGKGAASSAEHFIAGLKLCDVLAHRFDRSCVIDAQSGVLWFSQSDAHCAHDVRCALDVMPVERINGSRVNSYQELLFVRDGLFNIRELEIGYTIVAINN